MGSTDSSPAGFRRARRIAAIEALTGSQDFRAERRKVFQRRRDRLVEKLNPNKPSFPRRRESRLYSQLLDPRLREDD